MLRLGASIVALLALGTMSALAQTADKALINGKIITVDDRFTIGQAVAIRGQRILKVGSNAEIEQLRGPSTQIIDLAGRTVIPPDRRLALVRAAEHDSCTSTASRRGRARSNTYRAGTRGGPGAWIVVLGGGQEEHHRRAAVFRLRSSTASLPATPVAAGGL
jgi:predicted amidohydrolase YtcJ